jgi:hypothetical protein
VRGLLYLSNSRLQSALFSGRDLPSGESVGTRGLPNSFQLTMNMLLADATDALYFDAKK